MYSEDMETGPCLIVAGEKWVTIGPMLVVVVGEEIERWESLAEETSRNLDTVGVVEEKFDGYGFEKVQYVHIQFLFGGDAGLRIGVELGPSGNLKCNLIFE